MSVSGFRLKYVPFPSINGFPSEKNFTTNPAVVQNHKRFNPRSLTVRPCKSYRNPIGKACLPVPPFFQGLLLLNFGRVSTHPHAPITHTFWCIPQQGILEDHTTFTQEGLQGVEALVTTFSRRRLRVLRNSSLLVSTYVERKKGQKSVSLGIQSPKLRMVSWNLNDLCVSEVIVHPNHPLTR